MGKPTTKVGRVQGFESIREFSDHFAEQVDVRDSWNEVWSEILGTDKKKKKSSEQELTITDPFTGQKDVVFDASKHQADKSQSKEVKHVEKAHAKAEAAMDYHQNFVKNREITSQKESHEIHQRLNDIMFELQKLVNSSKVLQMEFAGVSVDQAPKQAGEYHLNFFDWLLLTIRSARQKVEDSGAWLATSKKKGGKGSWNNKQRQDWFANTSLSMGNESGGGYINQTG